MVSENRCSVADVTVVPEGIGDKLNLKSDRPYTTMPLIVQVSASSSGDAGLPAGFDELAITIISYGEYEVPGKRVVRVKVVGGLFPDTVMVTVLTPVCPFAAVAIS